MSRRPRDITGQRFGKLTAIRPTEERKDGSVVWECRCECGNTCYVSIHSLVTGDTRSCGCLKRLDVTGVRFGKLTAIRPTARRSSTRVIWECKCDCGNTCYVSLGDLVSGHTRSCGCAKRKDITGKVFGRLTAIRPTEERRGSNTVWECRCKCGNTCHVPIGSLTSGHTRSCGCLRWDKARRLGKRPMGKR